MATERANDLRAFWDFASQRLSNNGPEMTLDEALGLWDIDNAPDEEREDTVEAVKQAIDDLRAGDVGVPAREFLAEVRRKYNLPGSS